MPFARGKSHAAFALQLMPGVRFRVRALGSALLASICCYGQPAVAVCLLGDYSVEAEYSRSDAIITAVVVDHVNVPLGGEDYVGTNYTVEVLEIVKGELPKQLVVYSENSSGRFPMDTGVAYLLFIAKDLGQYTVDNCGNSGLLRERQQVLVSVQQMAAKGAKGNGGT